MDVLERLKACCSTDQTRPNLQKPFEGKWWGKRWAVATNGHALAAVTHDGELPTDGPAADAVVPKEWKPTHHARIETLRAWAHQDSECPRCRVQHSCSQPPEYPPREGRILGRGINRSLLAKALSAAPDTGTVEFMHDGDEYGPHVFAAGDWCAVVMPMRGVSGASEFTALTPIPSEKAG